MKNALPYRRELYRLWFEYLKLARSNPKLEAKSKAALHAALNGSSDFYEPWGKVDGIRFDDWWKDHRGLFEDTEVVRRLRRGEPTPLAPDILVVQIPLSQAPTALLRQVKAVIEDAFAELDRATKKSKKAAQSKYAPTKGSEPKLLAVREALTVYRDVILKKPDLRGQKMLDAVRTFYKARKNKKWAKIPSPLSDVGYGGEARAQRNLLRYAQRAEKIMLNVAKGEFPGKY